MGRIVGSLLMGVSVGTLVGKRVFDLVGLIVG